eukprot:3023604-Prymnesium_polylepis.1
MTEFLDNIPGKVDVPEGSIHRQTLPPLLQRGCATSSTEIPRQGGLSHYFNPEGADIIRSVGAFKAKERQQAVDQLLERQCTTSGFRPLDNLSGLHVQSRLQVQSEQQEQGHHAASVRERA